MSTRHTSPGPPKVRPAQLAFLAIYNPSLGPSDETFPDQLVYWYSRKYADARAAAKKSGRYDGAGGDAAKDEENERLRQIGLAQGMVDFARSFSNGEPVDSIETEKSRIVLREIENGWWILASIDLTRLPSLTSHSTPERSTIKGIKTTEEPQSKTDYSAREVAPAALLTQQLLQAHNIFTLHHGPSLSDLFNRLSRDKFCNTLDRFWSRFCKTWDVLLHGNPAADIFSGFKLAAGGELGFGVGEEDWGSGERDVLEDLSRRTEGMIDLIVARYGEPAQAEASDEAALPESENLPWMGGGSQPTASDGIVFGGNGAIGRPSLRNISLWMRQIYTYGEYGYGVRDNPLRERRKRRRRKLPAEADEPPPAGSRYGSLRGGQRGSRAIDANDLSKKVQTKAASEAAEQGAADEDDEEAVPLTLPKDRRPQIHPRVASHDHAAPAPEHTPPLNERPGIPPPIVSATEEALAKATKRADFERKSQGAMAENAREGGSTTWGLPDQYMKYLTFGISELAKGSSSSKPARPALPDRRTTTTESADSQKTIKPTGPGRKDGDDEDPDVDPAALTALEPMPEHASLRAKIAMQRRQENRGHFVIGLKGDLDQAVPNEEDEANATDGSFGADLDGSRIVLRTLQVEVLPKPPSTEEDDGHGEDEETLDQVLDRKASEAGLHTDGSNTRNLKRVRVLIYVHRPFMYCFLFADRTTSLSYTQFYRDLHKSLTAIHRPLLASTNAAKIAQRIEASHTETTAETASIVSGRTSGSNRLPPKGGAAASESRPIFDLLYDPRLLTVHCSIPNIPEPGTPAAQGISVGRDVVPAGWSRIEALNVHSAILNTLQSVKTSHDAAGCARGEIERTSKTSRGWWVVWMRFPPSDAPAVQTPAIRVEDADKQDVASSMDTLHDGDNASARPSREAATEKWTGSDNARSERARDSLTATPSTQLNDVNLPEGATDPVRTAATPPQSGQATRAASRADFKVQDMSRIAFLVRKSSDTTSTSSKYSSGSRLASSSGGGMSSMWSALGMRGGLTGVSEEEKTGGSAAGWGPSALSGGMGVDARRYVEGLLSLNR